MSRRRTEEGADHIVSNAPIHQIITVSFLKRATYTRSLARLIIPIPTLFRRCPDTGELEAEQRIEQGIELEVKQKVEQSGLEVEFQVPFKVRS
jgi:hypothetical protein